MTSYLFTNAKTMQI